jgi:hypothetical protein
VVQNLVMADEDEARWEERLKKVAKQKVDHPAKDHD